MQTAMTIAGQETGKGAGIHSETPMTDRMLRASADIWEAYHVHPFVRGIADGSLEPRKFIFYMLQDYVYLVDYARVFALGAAKSRDPEALGYNAAMLRQIAESEMAIHRSYLRRLGITEEAAAATAPALDNLSYTSYMIRVAYEGGAAEVAAAILSCALSYEAIARRIVAENPAAKDHPFYGEWVRGYASDDYHAANEVLIRLTEKLAAQYTEGQKRRMEEIFVNCSRYEAAFWDMAWEERQ